MVAGDSLFGVLAGDLPAVIDCFTLVLSGVWLSADGVGDAVRRYLPWQPETTAAASLLELLWWLDVVKAFSLSQILSRIRNSQVTFFLYRKMSIFALTPGSTLAAIVPHISSHYSLILQTST